VVECLFSKYEALNSNSREVKEENKILSIDNQATLNLQILIKLGSILGHSK
jgi:hypothetical protein